MVMEELIKYLEVSQVFLETIFHCHPCMMGVGLTCWNKPLPLLNMDNIKKRCKGFYSKFTSGPYELQQKTAPSITEPPPACTTS